MENGFLQKLGQTIEMMLDITLFSVLFVIFVIISLIYFTGLNDNWIISSIST